MIQREIYMQRIRPFINTEVVKVLTGIRRCGKSVMLQLIQQELLKSGVEQKQILSINFESGSTAYAHDASQTYSFIKNFSESISSKTYLFLDEIQELKGWETIINSCLIDFDVDIYITGSNAKMLSGELATYLSGRYVEFKIYPFSFEEVCQSMSGVTVNEVFKIYLVRGGMPFLYQFSLDEQSSKQYLEDIYSSIILKDIAQRNKIRDLEQLKRIIVTVQNSIS